MERKKGVIIVDIPSCCDGCDLYHDEMCYGTDNDIFGYCSPVDVENEIHQDCPIIEVNDNLLKLIRSIR